MITSNTSNAATTVGVSTTESFTIKASASAFKILSDGLYSNKIEAIVRELSANAVDSHVQAGKPELPIEVKLPNSIDSTFYVKDYGVGLSEEQIFSLYTTYFESLKQESNDFIGAFGLGSKSPFSYTDQFTVESIYDNTKTLYMCYLDGGLPKVSKVSSTPTTECTGMKVSLNVIESDFTKFVDALIVFKYYNVMPNILCNFEYEIVDGAYIRNTIDKNNIKNDNSIKRITNIKLDVNDWCLIDNGGCTVVQGGVAYPVDTQLLKSHGLSNINSAILESNNSVVFSVPLGSVQVAASREYLSYDPVTTQYLINTLNQIIDNIVNIIQSEIDKSATLWNAGVVLDSFCKHSTIYQIRNKYNFTYGSNTVASKIAISLENLQHTAIVQVLGRFTKSVRSSDMHKMVYDIVPTSCTKIIVGDKSNQYRKIKTWRNLNSDKYDTVIFITSHSDTIKTIIERLGNPEYEHISNISLPKQSRTVNGSITKSPNVYVRKVHAHGNNRYSLHRIDHTKLDRNVSIYIVRPTGSKLTSISDNMQQDLDFLHHSPNFNISVYWVNESYVNKIPVTWMSMDDYVKRMYATDKSFIDYFQMGLFRYNEGTAAEVMRKCIGCGSIVIDQFANKLTNISYNISYSISNYNRRNSIVNESVRPPEWHQICKKYPMLRAITGVHSQNKPIIVDYIKLMENIHV